MWKILLTGLLALALLACTPAAANERTDAKHAAYTIVNRFARHPMRPTQRPSSGSSIPYRPPQLREPLPGTSMEDLDAPAYTRGLTSLAQIQRHQALQAADRMDADNRSFNQQFWSTMKSEAGAVVRGVDTERLARWVSRILGGQRPDRG